MRKLLRTSGPGRPRLHTHLRIMLLEERTLLSGASGPGLLNPLVDTEPAETLDQAHDLGALSLTAPAEVIGTIGQGSAGAADVSWYRFALTTPAAVHLATFDHEAGSPLVSVLSLYNNDPNDAGDPYDPLGHRLLAQDDGAAHGGDAVVDRLFGSGSYYVAVSGSGNRSFNPFLAGSGYPGSTGAYDLRITATDAGISPGDGPTLLTADPAPGSTLERSPFVIRVDTSAALDPTTINAGQNATLTFNLNGTFGDGNDQAVTVTTNYSATADELQLFPAAPLAPGYYQVFLGGDASQPGASVLTDPTSTPLGKDAAHPGGQDLSFTFHIDGINDVAGAAAPDDTTATARPLGDITQAGLVQVAGAIGTDPTDPTPFNPTGVEMYHFQVSGPGRYAFTAEVFAGRIGSPLDPALSLFQLGGDGQLHLLGANDNTFNATPATNGTLPLFTDPVLYAGLTSGDYFLAVSTTGNLPDPSQGLLPGTNGIFNALVSHSAQAGATTGPYVLNLGVQPGGPAPTVLLTTLAAGDTLDASPTQLVVQFSEPVNVQQLAYQAALQDPSSQMPAIFIQGPDGTRFYPRLESYDPDTGGATFLMLDRLPNGDNQMHLSGPLGLSDLAGDPLVGNDPSGDYVVRFTVDGPHAGTGDNPLLWSFHGADTGSSQSLGVLFPHELQAGVQISREFPPANNTPSGGITDSYTFQVLQSGPYFFTLTGTSLPADATVTLTDAAGNPVPLLPQGTDTQLVTLDPGVYVVSVGGLGAPAAGTSYQLAINLGASAENPTPLTVRAAPAFRITLVNTTPPTVPPSPSPPPSLPSPPPAPPAGSDTGNAPVLVNPTPTVPAPAPTAPAPAPDVLPPPVIEPCSVGMVQVVTHDPGGSVRAFPADALRALRDIPAGGTSLAVGARDQTGARTLGGLPPDSLTGLSATPVGGARGANSDGASLPLRLDLRAPETPPQAERTAPAQMIQEVLHTLDLLWQHQVDQLFQSFWPDVDLGGQIELWKAFFHHRAKKPKAPPGAPAVDAAALPDQASTGPGPVALGWVAAGVALAAGLTIPVDLRSRPTDRFRRTALRKASSHERASL